MYNIYLIMKDFSKKKVTYIALMFQIFIATIILMSVTNQLLDFIAYNENFKRLARYNYFYFETYYSSETNFSASEFDLNPLTSVFENPNSFSFVEIPYSSDFSVVVGLGNFKNIYSINSNLNPTFFESYYGKDLNFDLISSSSLGRDFKIGRKNILDNKSYLLISAMESLDNKILITSDFNSFVSKILNKMTSQEKMFTLMRIIENLKFEDKDGVITNKLIENAKFFKGVDLKRKTLNTTLKNQYLTSKNSLRKVIAFFAVYIAFMLVGVFMFLVNILYTNFREYAILSLFGASNTDIIIRLKGNVFILLITPYILTMFTGLLIKLKPNILLIITVIYVLFYIFLSGTLVYLFFRKNELNFIRRNE